MAMYYYARKLQRSAASSSSSSSSSSSIPKANKCVSQRSEERSNNGPTVLPCCSFTRSPSKYDNIRIDGIHTRASTLLPPPLPPSINHSAEDQDHRLHDIHTNGEAMRRTTTTKYHHPYEDDGDLHNGVFELRRGSMEDVMEVLVPTDSHFPSTEILFAFLTASRLTTPPHQLLHQIFRRFYKTNTTTSTSTEQINHSPSQQPNNTVEIEIEECNLEETRVHLLVKFVRIWTELLPSDFRDDRLMHFVRIIARICININSQVREEVSQLLANLLSKLTALEVYEGSLGRIRIEASIGEPIAAPSVISICPNPVVMAEQLTLVEFDRFFHIGAQEFVSQLLRNRRSNPSGSGACDTTNLDAFIAWFKRLSLFVASEICKVGRECFKIRNFNSLMAILAGLNITPIARLKKTWGKICCVELIELQTAMDPNNNFSAYRTMYKTAVWESLRVPDESHNYKILVPYFSLLQRDVFNLNSAYPTVLSNGDINVEKFHHLAKLVKEIISWQSVDCPFIKIQSIFNAVQALPIFNDDELLDASYTCEEPESFEEKEEFAKLRRELGTVPLVSCNSSSEHLYHV